MTHPDSLPSNTPHGRVRAFSLLEMAVVLVLLSLAVSMAVSGLNALSGAHLREEAGVLAGVVRDTYARTALRGTSMRIVFNLDDDTYHIEQAAVVARLHKERREPDQKGTVAIDAVDQRLDHIEATTTDEQDRARLDLLSPPPFQPVDGEEGQPRAVKGDLHIKSVWTEDLDDRVTAGQAALYFFPGGETEQAHITLTDDEAGENTLTLDVDPLTGEVAITDEEPRVPEEEDD